MAKIIECVPNFSEGRDKNVIDQIVKAIASAKVTVNGNEAADREVLPFRLESRRLVAVARDAELVVDPFRQPARQFRAAQRP